MQPTKTATAVRVFHLLDILLVSTLNDVISLKSPYLSDVSAFSFRNGTLYRRDYPIKVNQVLVK